jgi:hypothetical protein
LAGWTFLLEEVVDFRSIGKAVAAGDDEGDPPPASADDGGQLVLQGAKLQLIIPLAGVGMVRLGGDQVTAGDQFVAFDASVVVNHPPIFAEGLGEVQDQPLFARTTRAQFQSNRLLNFGICMSIFVEVPKGRLDGEKIGLSRLVGPEVKGGERNEPSRRDQRPLTE